MYVVDASDEGRIGECNNSFQTLLVYEKLKKVHILVFGNKTDLYNYLGPG